MPVFGAFRLDDVEERLWNGPKEVPVRRKPFAILKYLVANPKRLVTHQELLDNVWSGAAVSESAVRTHLHELRQVLGEGVIETVVGRGYRFTAPLADDNAPAGVEPRAQPLAEHTLVGRDAELAMLRAALERARGGHRQTCFVIGEPGIGKTALVDAFLAEIERDPKDQPLAIRGQSVEQYGTPEAYLAVIEMFGRLRTSKHGDAALAALARYAPTFLAQVPHLVSDAQLAEVTRRAVGGTEAKMVRELIEAIEAIASQQTIVMVLEDLQWSDVAAIDLISVLAQRRERAKLLVIATSRRAEAQTVTHPLNRVMRNLVARSGATSVSLERIAVSDLRRLLGARFPGHTFPDALADAIDRITNGTPLFVTSLLDDLVGREMLVERDGVWRLVAPLDDVARHRPDSVKQLIDIQLDRLTPQEQRALEAGSVVGLEFSTAVVAAALDLAEEQVDEVFDGLARRALFLRRAESEEWPDGSLQTRYAVMHGLVHEVCLDRCAPARRQRWHRLIAERLEAGYGTRADEISHLLAMHFEKGQVAQRAMHYCYVAGNRTARRFASADAMSLFERAHSFVARIPASPDRDRDELRILQGLTSMVLRGHHKQPADPLARFERMIELARNLGDRPALCTALVNASMRLSTLGEYRRALALLEEVDTIEKEQPLHPHVIEVRDTARLVGMIWQGEAVRSLEYLEKVIPQRFDAPQFEHVLPDRSAVNLAYSTLLRWMLGFPEAAIREAEQARKLADASSDPWTVGLAYCSYARMSILLGAPVAEIRALAAHVMATPLAAVWHRPASLIVAWADAKDGKLDEEGVSTMIATFRERLRYQPMGPTHLGLPVIETLVLTSHLDEARALVSELLGVAEARNERLVESELWRNHGDLATDRAAQVDSYRKAIAIAQAQSAIMLQLRAANRLALVDAEAGRAQISSLLPRFTEGFSVVDLVEAKRLLA